MTAKAHRIWWSESGARSLLSTSASTAAIRPCISDVSRPFTDHLIDTVGSDAPSSQASLDAFQHLVNKHNPGDENARNLFEEEIDTALQDIKNQCITFTVTLFGDIACKKFWMGGMLEDGVERLTPKHGSSRSANQESAFQHLTGTERHGMRALRLAHWGCSLMTGQSAQIGCNLHQFGLGNIEDAHLFNHTQRTTMAR